MEWKEGIYSYIRRRFNIQATAAHIQISLIDKLSRYRRASVNKLPLFKARWPLTIISREVWRLNFVQNIAITSVDGISVNEHITWI